MAHDANYDGRLVVVYMSLELDGAHAGPPAAVRTIQRTQQYDHDAWMDILSIPHPRPDWFSGPETDCFRFRYLAESYSESVADRAKAFRDFIDGQS
jgi:hypothetical protein